MRSFNLIPDYISVRIHELVGSSKKYFAEIINISHSPPCHFQTEELVFSKTLSGALEGARGEVLNWLQGEWNDISMEKGVLEDDLKNIQGDLKELEDKIEMLRKLELTDVESGEASSPDSR